MKVFCERTITMGDNHHKVRCLLEKGHKEKHQGMASVSWDEIK